MINNGDKFLTDLGGDKLVNKKGFIHFIEIIFSIMLVAVIFVGFVLSSQDVFTYKSQQDLRTVGFQTLRNLDQGGAWNTDNFTIMEQYIEESLSTSTKFDWEYYNTSCYSIDNGILGSASDTCSYISASTEKDIVSSMYTHSTDGNIESIKIYLWRRL